MDFPRHKTQATDRQATYSPEFKHVLEIRKNIVILIQVAAASSRCLKITEKVSFNIASEASYIYILSGQKLIKNAKNGPFWRVF